MAASSRAQSVGGRAQGGATVAMGPAEAWRPLPGRPVVLLPTSSFTRPGALAGVDTLPRLPALAPARWAIQVLDGPGLSYRQLGSASQVNASTPPSVGYNSAANSAANPDVATLERPALAGGGELSIRRQLSGPWSLSSGLGYVEYATRLALQLARPDSSSRLVPVSHSTIASIHQRDTYRFVTIPVRLGYSRAVSGRWRVGVLAGADAAIYVGGRTSEGSACACQTQTWGDNSPYRRLSLGLSLGVEARYRLNGRWELLAQPTASYLLSPLNKLSTSDYERHLFGATALLGAAWDLP